MFIHIKAFSGFSVDSTQAAKTFYEETLGLDVKADEMGLTLTLAGGMEVFIYTKSNHMPASFTVLNFEVENIDSAVDDLVAKGVEFEHYDALPAPQDEKGVLRGRATNNGPDIAWFKDPAGNILAVLQQ